jgi:hypothetical protein
MSYSYKQLVRLCIGTAPTPVWLFRMHQSVNTVNGKMNSGSATAVEAVACVR